MTINPLIDERFWDIFSWKLKKILMVTEMCLPFSSVQWDWVLTERSLNNAWNPYYCEHSVNIQWTFRNVSVAWKEKFHSVIICALPDFVFYHLDCYTLNIFVVSYQISQYFCTEKKCDIGSTCLHPLCG